MTRSMSVVRRRSSSVTSSLLIVSSLTAFSGYAIGMGVLEAISVAIFTYSFVWYVLSLGRELAIIQVTAMIASGQWLLGPALAYSFDLQTEKYQMYVSSAEYFLFMIPSVILLIVGMVWFSPSLQLEGIRRSLFNARRIPNNTIYLIFFGGFLADFLNNFAPSALGFAFFIGSQFKFVAISYMIILRIPWRWWALALAFMSLASTSLETGLFHNFALWSALILSFIAYDLRLGNLAKFAIIFAMVISITQLQATKSEYRRLIQFNPSIASTETFSRVFFDIDTFSSIVTGGDILKSLNARLNQGWIISAVMRHTPSVQPFENGATVFLAFRDSLVPRFLVEKRRVEVSEAFRKYTGLEVGRWTSFGISVVGEAWVNFGILGSVFMGFFGALYGYILRFMSWRSLKYPSFILWAPLIFLQAIKAETELLILLNHLTKSMILIYALYWFSYRVLRFRL